MNDLLIFIMIAATGKVYQHIFYKYVDPVYHLRERFQQSVNFRVGSIVFSLIATITLLPLAVTVSNTNMIVAVIIMLLLFCIIITEKMLWD